MNISQDIRDLIKRVAQELAAADGALMGVIHAHAASNSIVAMVRQELDYVVHHGFGDYEPDAEKVDEPAADDVGEPTPAVKPKKAEPAPVVEPEEEKADEDGDAEA